MTGKLYQSIATQFLLFNTPPSTYFQGYIFKQTPPACDMFVVSDYTLSKRGSDNIMSHGLKLFLVLFLRRPAVAPPPCPPAAAQLARATAAAAGTTVSVVQEGQAGQQRLHCVHVVQVELRGAHALAHRGREDLALGHAGAGGSAAQDLVHHLNI